VNYIAGDLRDQLALVGYTLVSGGLVVGSGGNLSARSPGSDEIWVTAAGTWLDRLDRPDFVRVGIGSGEIVPVALAAADPDEDGVEDAAPRVVQPTSELALHLATYRARPDVNAVLHLHPQTAVLLDALDEPIRLITTDHAFYLRRVARTAFHQPGSVELASAAAKAAADGTNCVLLARHGCSVMADTVELAHKRALYLEEAARLTFRAVAAGVAGRLPDLPEMIIAS
jgi:ribulose-5-phosphate 4-epimerase/fuculose-1-phosphate aldolase